MRRRLLSDLPQTRRRSAVSDNIFAVATRRRPWRRRKTGLQTKLDRHRIDRVSAGARFHALRWTGVLALIMGRIGEAVNLFQEAIKQDPLMTANYAMLCEANFAYG